MFEQKLVSSRLEDLAMMNKPTNNPVVRTCVLCTSGVCAHAEKYENVGHSVGQATRFSDELVSNTSIPAKGVRTKE